jgi:GNAT superfamily N-acetyltransferase
MPDSSATYSIVEFDPKELDQVQWQAYFQAFEKSHLEDNPQDPLPLREERQKYMKSPNPDLEIHWWWTLSQPGDRVTGIGYLYAENEKSASFAENQQIAHINFYIPFGCREKSLEKAFAWALVAQAQAMGKSIIRVECGSPQMFDFWNGLGGKLTAERHTNRLDLGSLDWNLMHSWCLEGRNKAPGVTIETFQIIPERDIESFCKIYSELYNLSLLDDVSQHYHETPDSRRKREAFLGEYYIWTTKIIREAGGEISGLTEIFYPRNEPYHVEQELTAVLPQYRGRGLGKWLKAEMAYYIHEQYPAVDFIDTHNTDKNAPIMEINSQMGFKPYRSENYYEFSTETLLEHLKYGD